MILLFKSMFSVTVNTPRSNPAHKVSIPSPPSRDVEPSRDFNAEQLWKAWLEDDDWRVGKP